ncbi:MAG: c-type cytochrome [Saprospiraceae bacterium]|nr:c-type cytochrome [Saprospiraceae bacterium]
MKTKLFLLAAVMVASFTSCLKDEIDTITHNYDPEDYKVIAANLNLPDEVDNYTLNLPQTVGGFEVFADNKQATLGRVLFYDKRLSVNNEVNCASCHKPELAFTDGEQFSPGVTTERTSRNTLALGTFPSFNAYYGFGGTRMFWDNRASSVMEQSAETMKNPVEMGNVDLGELADKLLQEQYYFILFKNAFPYQTYLTNEEKMLTALQAFVSSIGCFNSKYDQELIDNHGDETAQFTKFTTQENQGKALYNTNCASCHNLGAVAFSHGIVAANNGLELDYQDEGVGTISNTQSDNGVFKVPMLRNIELTAPYMHDGRFATLEQVVEHYSSGIKNHPNLHENLKDGSSPKQLNLNESDKQALVAFLRTLTDKESLLASSLL